MPNGTVIPPSGPRFRPYALARPHPPPPPPAHAQDCWVPEEQVSQGLVDDLAARRPELFQAKGGEGAGQRGAEAAGSSQSRIQGVDEQAEQQQPGGGNVNGNGNGAAAGSNGRGEAGAAAAGAAGGAKQPAGALRS